MATLDEDPIACDQCGLSLGVRPEGWYLLFRVAPHLGVICVRCFPLEPGAEATSNLRLASGDRFGTNRREYTSVRKIDDLIEWRDERAHPALPRRHATDL